MANQSVTMKVEKLEKKNSPYIPLPHGDGGKKLPQ